MLARNDEAKGIDIDITLTDAERAILGSHVKTQAFDIIQKLMEDQVRKFNLQLVNTPVSERVKVLANHALAKAASQFYAGLMERLETELQIENYNNRRPNIDRPENNISVEEFR